jgi:hypothetical protein
MIRRSSALIVASGLFLSIGSANAAAQQPVTTTVTAEHLSELLPSLYIESLIDSIDAFREVFGPGDLISLRNQLDSAYQINDLLGQQLSSFPLGSSAGGFTWTFDATSGTYNRASNTFGPTFTERALTIGRNRFNLGVNFQRATFDQIEGKDLDGGDIKIYTGLRGVFFEDSLDLKVSTNTLGLFANYGVTDRLDVGVAIPIVQVDMEARLTSRVGTSSGGVLPTATPFIYEGADDASGIGDIVVRGKYNFWRMRGGGLAAGVDLRLPTGDELDLLGIAGSQGKFYLAASGAYSRLSPHFNFGFTISGDSEAARDPETFVFAPPDEIGWAGGMDFAASSALTISGDIIGRTMRDIGRLEDVPTEFGTNYREFAFVEGNLNMLLGAVGAKYNPFPNALFSANVLFPLNKSGLTDYLTWVIGFDYSF